MTLSALITKGGLAKAATATPATIATQETDQAVTVASVATVAVAVKPEPQLELSADEESGIREWLADIGEDSTEIIGEVLDKCRTDNGARAYFLRRADEVPKSDPEVATQPITCGTCQYFQRTEHPHLGHCAQGEPEATAGLWDTDRRYCESFTPLIDQQGDNHADD